MSRPLSTLARIDWLLVLPAALLSFLGLAAIGSVGLAHDPPTLAPVIKQAIALGLGMTLALGLTMANYRALDHYARLLYILAGILLLGVLFFGRTINGTKGWFLIGGWGVQPVEFAKVALVVIMARFMSKHAHVRELRLLVSSGILMALFAILVLRQPDFGGAMVLASLWFFLLLIAGIKRRHLLTMVVGVLLIAAVSWLFLLKDYQRGRIETFFDPSRAPLAEGYNSTQAKIAIGAGGLFGRGLGFGSQSQLRFVPEAQTDFLFSVIGEELGFVTVLIMFGLFVLFFFRAVRIAERSGDNFPAFLALGLVLNIFLATVVNIGMNLGLLPVTGIALPFLSAGGSSLIATWIAVGLLQSIAVRREGTRLSLTEDGVGSRIPL
ncbi:rod shape-determining protein RodA [Patescibacteria group bacterium]|nr:rod shape-determining protein RodA [Patescibacteria group bacterium]